jgi:hypothetical protein
MPPTERGRVKVTPFVALALIAAAGVAIVAPLLAAVPHPSAGELATPPRPGPEADQQRPEARLRSLQRQRVEREPVEAETAGPVPDAHAEDTSTAAEPPLGPEEESHREDETWKQRLTRFEAQPVDVAWGADEKERLLPILNPLAEKLSGRVSDLECRASQCRATIDWEEGKVPTMEDGTTLMLETIPATPRCARHVRLSDPHNRHATTLIIECG